MTTVAVVTPAHGRHDHLARQHESLACGSRLPDLYVVAAIDDDAIRPTSHGGLERQVVPVPGDPAGLPLAAARNRGVDHALGLGADVVVLLDVDCLAGTDLVAAYAAACAAQPAVVWSGPVTYLAAPPAAGYDLSGLDRLDAPHSARPDPGRGRMVHGVEPDLFWSLSFAVSASGWRRVGGFCERYVGYGAEDTDFGQLVVERGLDHGCPGDARAYHQWHPVTSPPVEHVDDILRNGAIFHERWGRWPMTGWLDAFEERGLAVRRGEQWVRV